MSRIVAGCVSTLVCSAVLFVPSHAFCDFVVTNMFAEVGVTAGDVTDGVGGHSTSFAEFSISDGTKGTANYQLAEALFNLQLSDDSMVADYLLTYESEIHIMTGGEGIANALSNGIFVFNLTEDFEATAMMGDAELFDSLGENLSLLQDETVLLEAGNYSVSFGASGSILSTDDIFERTDSVFGQIAFNSTAVPEPTAATILLAAVCLGIRRRR